MRPPRPPKLFPPAGRPLPSRVYDAGPNAPPQLPPEPGQESQLHAERTIVGAQGHRTAAQFSLGGTGVVAARGFNVLMPERLMLKGDGASGAVDVYAAAPDSFRVELVIRLYAINGPVRTLVKTGRLIRQQVFCADAGQALGQLATGGLMPCHVIAASFVAERWEVTAEAIWFDGFTIPGFMYDPNAIYYLSAYERPFPRGDTDDSGVCVRTRIDFGEADPLNGVIAIDRPQLVMVQGVHAGDTACYFQLWNSNEYPPTATNPVAEVWLEPNQNFSMTFPDRPDFTTWSGGIVGTPSSTNDDFTEIDQTIFARYWVR